MILLTYVIALMSKEQHYKVMKPTQTDELDHQELKYKTELGL